MQNDVIKKFEQMEVRLSVVEAELFEIKALQQRLDNITDKLKKAKML